MQKNIFIVITVAIIFAVIGLYLGYQLATEPEVEPSVEPTDQPAKPTVNSEQEQMFQAARQLIMQYSAPEMQVRFEIIKQLDQWALLRGIPVNIETDNVGVVKEKVNGQWLARDFGTILPGWKERVPELFE